MSLSGADILAEINDYQAGVTADDRATPAELQERAENSKLFVAYRDLLGFDVHIQPHLEFCEKLDARLGDYTFKEPRRPILMGWPRGTFKTTLGAQGLAPIILGENPNARILITSFRHDVAKRRLRACKQTLESNQKFKDEYGDGWKPEFREDIWSDDAIYVAKRTSTLIDPSIATGGVDRSLTGGHFDVIIADDIVTDTNVRTPDARQKVYDYAIDLLPILEPGGLLIFLFTRWHIDDAYGRLIRLDEDRARRGKPEFFEKTIHSAHNADGTLFFPARLTESFLQDQKDRLGSRKYSAQYENKPVADEDRTFAMDKARIRNFDFFQDGLQGIVSVPGRGQVQVLNTLAWDPAGRKAGKNSDTHGVTVRGTDFEKRCWVLESAGLKGPPSEIVGRICLLIAHYRPWAVSCEDVQSQGVWLDLLGAELDRRGMERPEFIYWSTHNVPKNERIAAALQPSWERGEIIVRPTQIELIRQFEQFTQGAEMDHEDELDSLVQHESYARAPDRYAREILNPIDPEYVARRARMERLGNAIAKGVAATQWDIGEDAGAGLSSLSMTFDFD